MASKRKSKSKPAKPAKRKRKPPPTPRKPRPTKAERERAARLARKAEQARRRRKRARSLERGHEREYFATILESMAERSPLPVEFSLTSPEPGATTPWLVVGKYVPTEDVGYAEIFDVFKRWENDLFLETKIHPQRRSQIRVWYDDPNSKRGESDSYVAHYGPWEFVASAAAGEVDPSDEDSLASRYQHTLIRAIYVYFAAERMDQLQHARGYSRGAGKPR